MEYRVRIMNVLGVAIVTALAVGASLVTSTIVAARAYEAKATQLAESGRVITVKGYARTRVQSDRGVWIISVSGDGPDLGAAYAVLDAATARVQSFLAEQGFAPGEIQLSAIDTSTHFQRDPAGRETRDIAGYTLGRQFTVTSGEVLRIAAAAGEVTRLLQQNVRVASSRPQYLFTKVSDLKVKVLGDAASDARTRAEQMAANSACRVGEVRQINQGVIQITRPDSTEVSGYGLYDTDTIEKDVSVAVTVTLGVESL
jgi:hypothetical protein